MRSRFPGYYRRTDKELSRIWEDGIFVLDANVLLNLYRYSEGTREELLGVLCRIKDRLWVPRQVADEFHSNRQSVIEVQRSAYSAVQRSLSEARKEIEQKLGEMHTDPGIVEAKDLRKQVEESFQTLINEAERLQSDAAIQSIQPTDSPDDDEIWQVVVEIVGDSVGDGLSPIRMQEVLDTGPRRYESKVPPGYEDAKKPGDDKFGDLILWFETIDKAKETNKPILFVTDDRKEDWWSKSGKVSYPHPNLGNEMHRVAGVLYHMFMPLDLMKWAGPRVDQEISDEAAVEVEELEPLDDVTEASDLVDRDLFNLLIHPDYGQVIGVEDLLGGSVDPERLARLDPDGVIRRAERLERLMKEDPAEYQAKLQRLERLSWESESNPEEYIRRLERRLRKLDR